jgi:hypothetical protein
MFAYLYHMCTSTWSRFSARMMSEIHARAFFKVSEELVDVEKIVVKEVHVPFDVYVDNIVVKEVEQVVEIERLVVKEVEVPIERCASAFLSSSRCDDCAAILALLSDQRTSIHCCHLLCVQIFCENLAWAGWLLKRLQSQLNGS